MIKTTKKAFAQLNQHFWDMSTCIISWDTKHQVCSTLIQISEESSCVETDSIKRKKDFLDGCSV